ncbi:class I SAM-dependent methyltransferase [Streptomyces sp. VRA16 Mangrove soil]|uniref:class I SAM-dependent methyltransferase n=1 Tax=Streptomyces sp. VRA16 Mangrove soil TaxID=2817434 RepID=UPI001A9F3E6C|nr:class I SAM-dependent methyltransferase [Streptomyces sp. VRA16 Mangrove soil]MBO1331058.1 methyltransferase domain-containing protein [Streptomyces sp. VRA16 Mangrove soil]
MLDYDQEAARYDATRGGEPRARAAADAVLGLVPDTARTLLDLACGTGIVTRRLARTGLRPLGVDLADGMLRAAGPRLDGRVVRADTRRLPFPDGTFDAVTAIWLLHLLDDAEPVVAEAARVLRPGGVFVTTVDKDAAHLVGSDVCALVKPYATTDPADASARVTAYARRRGLHPCGEARFLGHGQGRTPNRLARHVRQGRVYKAGGAELAARLEALPDPELPRPDPTYTLLAFRSA